MRRGEAIFRDAASPCEDLFVGDFVADHEARFLAEMSDWVAQAKVDYREDIRQGLEHVPEAFADMLRGANFGKMLVQIAPDPTEPGGWRPTSA